MAFNNGQYCCSEALANGIIKFSKKNLDPLQDKILLLLIYLLALKGGPKFLGFF
jgi:hypothetical protein